MIDGTVWSAGNNYYGQLCRNALDGSADASNLASIPGVADATDIAAGENHSLIVRDGQLWSAGYNINSQLCRTGALFGQVPGVSDATAVAAGANYSLVIRDGQLWSAGYNESGQLCRNASSFPVYGSTNFGQVANVANATAVAAFNHHSLVIRDGQLWSAGYNEYGQLCRNMRSGAALSANFGQVPGVDDATAIAAGADCSFILRSGQLWNAGATINMFYGGGGNGSATATNFGQVAGVTDATAIAAGYSHVLVIRSAQLWSAGANNNGQLCRDGSPYVNIFAQVSGVDNVAMVAAGEYGSHVVRGEQLWNAGNNEYGQLCRSVANGSATATNFGRV